MKIKAVIFDMDGVLIDAKEWHYESLNRALSLFGAEINRYDHVVTFDGLPTARKLQMLSSMGKLPAGLHTFINDLKQQYTMELIYSKCKPIFQHQYALAKLKNNSYRLVVCSNSVRKTVEVMMEKSGLFTNLEFMLSNQDVKKGKPDPEIYNMAINKLGLTPQECLIIEDNENGVRAAIASGANVMIVTNPDDVHYNNIMNRIHEIENA